MQRLNVSLAAVLTLAVVALSPASATTPTAQKESSNMTTTTEARPAPSTPDAIRPFRVHFSNEALADLRRRIADTRWPTAELVEDRSQGVQLKTLRALAQYWSTDYDWRKCEARLNALPQFTTEIDGVDIHFIHVRSRHENALPLIMTHGWPGSVIELLETVGPLTDPTARGGLAEDAFDLVLPSLPGYGFSSERRFTARRANGRCGGGRVGTRARRPTGWRAIARSRRSCGRRSGCRS